MKNLSEKYKICKQNFDVEASLVSARKENKGIARSTLIIAIIVMLILVTVGVHILIESNLIDGKTYNSIDEYIETTKEEIVKVNIIDKYNNIKQLYKDAEKEEYVLVDIEIGDNYYTDVGIRTKGSSIYAYLKYYRSDRYSYKVKLNYKNKEQEYNRNDRNLFKHECYG